MNVVLESRPVAKNWLVVSSSITLDFVTKLETSAIGELSASEVYSYRAQQSSIDTFASFKTVFEPSEVVNWLNFDDYRGEVLWVVKVTGFDDSASNID